MPVLFEGDCLVILIAIAAVSLPLRWPKPFATRRAAHTSRVKARAVAAANARQKQAELDTILARVYARADHEMRMARIEGALNAGDESAELEEFYAQL